jgi:hypothetical protein
MDKTRPVLSATKRMKLENTYLNVRSSKEKWIKHERKQ